MLCNKHYSHWMGNIALDIGVVAAAFCAAFTRHHAGLCVDCKAQESFNVLCDCTVSMSKACDQEPAHSVVKPSWERSMRYENEGIAQVAETHAQATTMLMVSALTTVLVGHHARHCCII